VSKPINFTELDDAMRRVMQQAQRRRKHSKQKHDSASAPIDRAYALSLIGGNSAALDRITTIFGEEAGAILGRLENGFRDRDLDTARRAAHSMKGSAATIGAMALSRVAERMEQLLKSEQWEEGERLLPDLQASLARVLETLQDTASA
jgi:HPt (histidine-containing phosphotransfer) domain-containing protein